MLYQRVCFSLQGLVMPPQQPHPPQGVMHPNPRGPILFPQQAQQTYPSQGIVVQNRPPRWPLPMMQSSQQTRQFSSQSALIAQLTQPSMGPAVNPTALAVTGQFNQSKCSHFCNLAIDCVLLVCENCCVGEGVTYVWVCSVLQDIFTSMVKPLKLGPLGELASFLC
jgi:hypothetical protein